MTDKRINKLKRKLQEARYRLITREPELAAPLADMLFVADVDVYRISTNGTCIYFEANWLEKLKDNSLDFALCHQLMHIQMDHLARPQYYKGDRFHFACNIIVNSALILYGFTDKKLPGIGEIRHETFYPSVEGCGLTPLEAFKMTPFDPSAMSEAQRRNLLSDSDEWWDRQDAGVENGVLILSPSDPDPDDLVLSEQIRGRMETQLKKIRKRRMPKARVSKAADSNEEEDLIFEYSTRPTTDLKNTIKDIRSIKGRDAETYGDSDFSERILNRANVVSNDWKALLNRFIMDETKDYSFTPPDRRMQDLDFFLPDYNESEIPRLNVLFMVDISASLKDSEVSAAIGEIRAAIEQFGGMLNGYVGFFDFKVRQVIPITNADNLLRLTPHSGGGTDFNCVFGYVKEKMADNIPSEIVIMTDGKGDFPEFDESLGIPVLWLLTTNRVRVPWGQAAYFRNLSI